MIDLPLLGRLALRVGCAIAALNGTTAHAGELDLISANTFEISGDVRLSAATGEKSWLDGGFGKFATSGNEASSNVEPQLGRADLVWKPQLGWAVSAVVVGTVQGGERTEAGLSQGYLVYRPMRSEDLAFSARAGLMWPPVSLEHEGLSWQVKDSITPSAINSWIGEEVRPLAIEATVDAHFGTHRLRATAAVMAANDTAGTLLTFRGWALHDKTTVAFNRQPLPPLGNQLIGVQAPFTHPLIDLPAGFAHRPGYYAKLSWQPPVPIRVELFRYDNNANPQVVNSELEWGWRTWFNDLGISSDLGDGTQLKAQALDGRTRMGFRSGGRRWVDNRFRSAFALVTHEFGKIGLSGRVESFETRNRGSLVGSEYNETGWSAMVAAKREWRRFTGLLELLHVHSRRRELQNVVNPLQKQTELQADLRMHW